MKPGLLASAGIVLIGVAEVATNAQGGCADWSTTATVVSIWGGARHLLVLGADGLVWDWGVNDAGQLGNGSLANSNVPVQVSGLSGVLLVTGGYNYSVALMGDHTLQSWGGNGNGQLGEGSTASYEWTPVAVKDLTNITQVSAGWKHVLAVRSDGTVWTWGQNANGELG